MINNEKWISTLAHKKVLSEDNEINSDRWVNSITKEKKFNAVRKYSFAGVLFVCGLLLVSAVKNQTRNLQKEINNLQASINFLKFNVDQAILDNEVITSPENISFLAKEYLNSDLTPYKVSQIKKLDNKDDGLFRSEQKEENVAKNLPVNIKSQLAKKILQKKNEIKKLQELYSDPKKIPDEVKTKVAKQIEVKKTELKKIYNSPKEYLTLERVQKWGAVQVVKLFLGIPVVPGR